LALAAVVEAAVGVQLVQPILAEAGAVGAQVTVVKLVVQELLIFHM
jgi:hypothetical protein